MTTPIGGTSGPTPITSPSGSSSTGGPSLFFADTLSLSPELLASLQLPKTGIQIPSGGISLVDWFKTIVDSKTDLGDVLKEIFITDPLTNRKNALQAIAVADSIMAQIQGINDQEFLNSIHNAEIRAAESRATNAQNTLADLVNGYNGLRGQFQSLTSALNSFAQDVQDAANAEPFDQTSYDIAVNNYNIILPIYNTLITNYNNLAQGTNDTRSEYIDAINDLNAEIDAKNAIIDQKNIERAQQGLDLLPRQENVTIGTLPENLELLELKDPITSNTPPPPSNITEPHIFDPITFVPTVIPSTPESVSETITLEAQKTILSVILVMLSLNFFQTTSLEDNVVQKLLLFQREKSQITLGDFITQIKEALTGAETTSVASLVSGLNSGSIEGVLAQVLFQESIQGLLGLKGERVSQTLADNFSTLLAAMILTAVQMGISPSGSIGSNISVSIESRKFLNTFIVSLSFANQLVNLITSETFRQQVANMVNKDPQLALLINQQGFNPEVRNQLIDVLVNAGTITLLMLASAQLDKSLGAGGFLLQSTALALLIGISPQSMNINDIIQLVTGNLSLEEKQKFEQDLTNTITNNMAAMGVADAKKAAEEFVAGFLAGQIPSAIPGLTQEQTELLVQSAIVSAITSGIVKDAQSSADRAEDQRKTREVLETTLRDVLPEGSTLIDDVLALVGNPGSPDEFFAKLKALLTNGLTGIPGGSELANELTVRVFVVYQEAEIRRILNAGIGGGPEINLLASEVIKVQNQITDFLQNSIKAYNEGKDKRILALVPLALSIFLASALDPTNTLLNDRLELGITYINALQQGSGSASIAGLAQQTEKKEVDFRA